LQAHPDVLGCPVDSSASALPYLFKVLSVAKALSIQAHPDKRLAEALHASRPDVYKDANHKPEMALALTPFEAMCGFRSLKEISDGFQACPELCALVGEEAVAALIAATSGSDTAAAATSSGGSAASASAAGREALKVAFGAYMSKVDDAEAIATATGALVARLEADSSALPSTRNLILRLSEQYPGDVGLFAPLWLNTLTLEPGQAIFLAANEPHAYLSGDCVECMACSDNVVRAGLTPKLKDVPTLVSMLTYS
jgi:mannose-6-phosphate isomerase